MSEIYLFLITKVKQILTLLGLSIIRTQAYEQLLEELHEAKSKRYLETRDGFLEKFISISNNPTRILENLPDSQSQLLQDLFVLETLEWKRAGFFVEFGATNGITLSNTYLLEKNFSWAGILVEPARNWHSQLHANRTSYISEQCVYSSDGGLIQFNQSINPEFSTIDDFTNFDGLEHSRNSKETYLVETILLSTLLHRAGAPKYIDYISIDTEGSEFEILNAFEFGRYEFGIMTVEHNHNSNESRIDHLLSEKGYQRVHPEISKFDGWYINRSLLGSK